MNRWETFSAAPHRMMMFGGALQLVLTLLLWGLELLGRHTGLVPVLPLVVPGVWIHGFLMLFMVFPFFILGFLMTTYPRWMNGREVPRGVYVTAFVLLFLSLPAFYAGMFAGRGVMVLGVGLLLAGWVTGTGALYRVFRRAPAADKRYERLLNLWLGLGTVGMLLYGAGLVLDRPVAWILSLQIGLWGFLVPVLVTVSHRMLPFFSESVLNPYERVQPWWLLRLMLMASLLHPLMELAGFHGARLLPDLVLFLGAGYFTVRWGLWRSLAVPLLAVLHLAFAWLAIGMLLFVLQDLALLFHYPVSLGRAPLHALGIGFIASMTMAMATRVTLGHSGRPLRLDAWTAWLFAGLNGAALLRILAELPGLDTVAGLDLNVAAALLWLASLSPWAWRYGGMYLRPRVDGRPG